MHGRRDNNNMRAPGGAGKWGSRGCIIVHCTVQYSSAVVQSTRLMETVCILCQVRARRAVVDAVDNAACTLLCPRAVSRSGRDPAQLIRTDRAFRMAHKKTSYLASSFCLSLLKAP